MKNFARNLTVRWRLIGFVCFMFILVTGVGLGGLYGMRSINRSLSVVYEHQVMPLEKLREIDYIFQVDIVNTVDKAIFEQISWPEALKTIRDSKDSIDKKWAFIYGLGETHTGMLGNSWLGTSKDVISSTDQIAAELIQHFENRNLSALDTFTDQKLYPFAGVHRRTINALIQDRLLSIKGTYKQSQENVDLFQKVFIFIMVVGIVISFIASYLLIKGIDCSASDHLGQKRTVNQVLYTACRRLSRRLAQLLIFSLPK